MRVLIVEDEILLAKRLHNLLQEVEPGVSIAGTTHSVKETVQWLQEHPAPDLMLMDIELADGQSFDIFRFVEVNAPIIFTTAYDEYAIKAFKLNSIDYLLKPIKEAELRQAIEKYKKSRQPASFTTNLEEILAVIKLMDQQQAYRNRFLIKQGQKLVSIDVQDLAYISSVKGYSYLRTKQNQKYIIEYTLDELEKSLSPQQFFRANRSYIVSSSCVAAIHSWFNQKLKVDLQPDPGEQVIISRDKAPAFKAWMGE